MHWGCLATNTIWTTQRQMVQLSIQPSLYHGYHYQRSLSNADSTPSSWLGEGFRAEAVPSFLMGHTMPKVYVLIAEVFALPQDADTDAIIRSMTAGLEQTLSEFPITGWCLSRWTRLPAVCLLPRRLPLRSAFIVKHMLREVEFRVTKNLKKKMYAISNHDEHF